MSALNPKRLELRRLGVQAVREGIGRGSVVMTLLVSKRLFQRVILFAGPIL